MAPLIFLAASVPLALISVIFLGVNLFLGVEGGEPRAGILYTVGIIGVLALLLVSMFVRQIRSTYGERVGHVFVSLSALLLTLTSTLWNPWNWIFVVVWLLFVAFDIWLLRRVQRSLGLTREQTWNLDSLSLRYELP